MYKYKWKQKQSDKERYEKKRLEILEQKRLYYKKNRDKILAYSKNRFQKIMQDLSKKEILQRKKREWVIKNIDKHKRCTKNWRLNNLEKLRVYSANRRALERNAEGTHTLEQWNDILKIFNYSCAMCKTKENITIDHKIPLNKGGTNYINNIQPLCFHCNASKQDKLINEYVIFSS